MKSLNQLKVTSRTNVEITHMIMQTKFMFGLYSVLLPFKLSAILTNYNALVYAASTTVMGYFYALANPLEFELHVPADCEQTCSNIPGSYTCSCVSGYQLDYDGKSCIGEIYD